MLKMPRQTGAFPPANNLLQKKWNEKAYKQHLEKRKSMTTGLNTKKPKSYLHLQLNLKKIQLEEERQESIDHENRILLAKLTTVIQSAGQLDNWNEEYDELPKSLNRPHMLREQERITAENSKLSRKLTQVTAEYDFDQWEDEYLLHEYYLSLKAQETKGFEVDVRGFDDEEPHYYKEVATADASVCQSDGGKTDASEQSYQAAGSTFLGSKANTQSKKPPGAFRRVKPQPKLPLLGQSRKKEEEKKKKEAASKPAPYDDKEDAARLFKATKGMVKAESAFTHALARRTYTQRQQTKTAFEKQYELDLEIELIELLGEEWTDIIVTLLARREMIDAVTLRQALKGELPLSNTVVGLLCTRNNSAINAIKKAYAKEYSTQLIDDIKNETKGQLRHLFLALAKGTRMEGSETDVERARRDAEVLQSEPEGDRWKADTGKMAELLRMASLSQIREVLEQYEQLQESKVQNEFQKLLAGDYRDAMQAMVKCLYHCAMYMAERHRTSLVKRDSYSLIRLLVTRSEIDMPQIRKAYRQRYGETLMDAIESLCKEPYKKALVAMVQVHGTLANQQQDQQQQQQQQKADNPGSYGATKVPVLPMVVSPSNKAKPLRRPSPNKTATLNAANPLMQSIKTSQGEGGGGARESILVSRRVIGAPKKTVTVVDPKAKQISPSSSQTSSASKRSPTKAKRSISISKQPALNSSHIKSTRKISVESSSGATQKAPGTTAKASPKNELKARETQNKSTDETTSSGAPQKMPATAPKESPKIDPEAHETHEKLATSHEGDLAKEHSEAKTETAREIEKGATAQSTEGNTTTNKSASEGDFKDLNASGEKTDGKTDVKTQQETDKVSTGQTTEKSDESIVQKTDNSESSKMDAEQAAFVSGDSSAVKRDVPVTETKDDSHHEEKEAATKSGDKPTEQ